MKRTPFRSDNMWKDAPASVFSNANKLREHQTEAEGVLWLALKDNQVEGYKFRRQHPIGIYIADFYCHKLKLVIEIDGEYHLSEEQQLVDKERTKFLEFQGLKVIRFSNKQVLFNLPEVIDTIKDLIKSGA
jgi:very-short-patch-repair endonuclease